jgi:wee1-like protein kinase
MQRTKTTPRPRGGKARTRAAAAASAVKAKPAAEGNSPSGELSLQLEHVSLISFLSDRRPAAAAAAAASGLTPFEALLEEEEEDGYRVDLAPPPPPQPQAPLPVVEASPMDADEPMEEKDCCILSQDFFWSVPIRALRWSADSMASDSD